MKKSLVLLLAVAVLLLSACTGESSGETDKGGISVYRLIRPEYRTNGELIRPETIAAKEGSDIVLGAAYALKSVPADSELASALPADVSISSASLSGKTVDLIISDSYGELTGMEKTIVDSCVTLTMCSIPGVDKVSIHTLNEPSSSVFTTEDFLLRDTEAGPESAEIRLYFALPEENLMASEYRSVAVSEDVSPERRILEELLKGPKSEKLRAVLPSNTVVPPSVYTQEGVCTVTFASGFLSGIIEDASAVRLAVYSVVNSLTCLSTVDSVQIVIQNDDSHMLGALDISRPLTRRPSMIGSAVIEN